MKHPNGTSLSTKRQKILIVDDKEPNLFALENVLEKIDADVIRADCGQSALAQVLDHDFALIILDVRMPGMDGYEVAEHLQGDPETKEIPLIFLTAEYPEEAHIFKGYEAGAIDYMLKPYSPRILLSKVKILLEMDRNKNELQNHRDLLEAQVIERTAKLVDTNFKLKNEIIERQRAATSLEQNQKALAEAQSIARLGSYVLEIISGVWKSSDILDEIFGIEEKYERSIAGWVALIHPDDRAMMSDYLKKEIIGNLEIFNKDYRIIRQNDGVERWVHGLGRLELDETGAPVKLIGTIQDITELKGVQVEKERLMAAINQAAETIVITDVKGTIEYANPAFEKITGYTCEEAMGKNPRVLQSGEHGTSFYQQMWNTLLSGKTWSGRMVNRKKDGTLFTEDATISPVKNSSGNIVNYVAVKRDVTEEIKLEEQIRQSQKMDSIGQLVGGVAHDFNNLLQIINGYVDLTRLHLEPGHAAIECLEEVSKAGMRANELVKQLLTFSRQQVIDPTHLDLNAEIENTQKMLGRLIGEHIDLNFIAGKNLGTVFADKGQIHQVLMNLCVNARDAMPDGGSLTLKTEGCLLITTKDLMDHGGVSRSGHYVLLSITDTGCGMDKSTCQKIFDPFFTTKALGKGTGLGLSTVYGIIKQNEGHIVVYSEPGNGTTFKIYFPVSNRHPIDKHPSRTENATPIEGGTETLLVVEDEEILLKLAAHSLSSVGYNILSAQDGEEALRIFQEHADEIDLVVMDVVMPRMGGKKAMEEILKLRPAIRYLFVSGYNLDAGHNDFIKDKNLHLLNKPYRAKALLKKIRDVLDEDRITPDGLPHQDT